MMFKICLVECGGIATMAHGPSLKKYADENPGVELSACCDVDILKVDGNGTESQKGIW